MQRSNAAFWLLLALVTHPAFSLVGERLKVEVVQTHAGVRLGDAQTGRDSEDTVTRCNGVSGTYTREFGYHCCKPGPQADAQNLHRSSIFYDVDVIMPNDAHMILHCSSEMGKNCATFPSYPEGTTVACSDFATGKAAYEDCTASGSSAGGIGIYEASLHGDKVTIFGASWKRVYVKYGTWQEASPAQKPPAASDTKLPALAPDGTTIDPQLIEQAKGGDAVAQYKLGYDYYLGRGIAQDFAQAAVWWKNAADQGYADAQNNLGVLYNSGKGVPQSFSEAYFWQNLAAARANGSLQTQFAKNRDDSASRLTFFEKLRVQKRASKWAADHPVKPTATENAGEHPADRP
ncbi:MAG TPA: tetratricopeptide repeat protein [Terracidiphilus sp.]|jgi:hypothetical protein